MNITTNRYSNYQNMIGLAEPNWNEAESLGLSNLQVNVEKNNYLKDQYGRYFHHFCTTSYLGLDYHPALLNGAIKALQETGTLRIANSRNRCKLAALADYEYELSTLFNATATSLCRAVYKKISGTSTRRLPQSKWAVIRPSV